MADQHPLAGHVYWLKEDRTDWAYVGPWKHPRHQPYHVNWTGEYAIMQRGGNFSNEMRLIEVAKFEELFELAWEPMRVCKFCGFTRMRPCTKRQTCASLTDYRLEPDDVHDESEAPTEEIAQTSVPSDGEGISEGDMPTEHKSVPPPPIAKESERG